MIDRCAAVLRGKLDELRRLVDAADLPAEAAQAILDNLARMEQAVADMAMPQSLASDPPP